MHALWLAMEGAMQQRAYQASIPSCACFATLAHGLPPSTHFAHVAVPQSKPTKLVVCGQAGKAKNVSPGGCYQDIQQGKLHFVLKKKNVALASALKFVCRTPTAGRRLSR